MRPPLWTRITSWALLLGLGHALVDAAGGFLIHADMPAAGGPGQPEVVRLVLLYNLIAFASQAPLGYLADRLGAHRGAAMLGLLAGMIALIVGPRLVMVQIVAAGLGNALFHVGAGALVLMVSGVRAAEAGVFVGPGAMGLYGGGMLGRLGLSARWILVALLGLWIPLVRALGRRMSRLPS